MWKIEGLFLVFLIIGSIWDMVRKKIPLWYFTLGAVITVVHHLLRDGEFSIINGLGILIGSLFLMISKVTEEGIGYGDSLLILLLGFYLGLWKLLVVLMLAFSCASIVAGIGMVCKKCTRKTRLAFFPFLTIGYLGVLGW